MNKLATCRIDGIIARGTPLAVVFRRGPSKMTQLLTWNLRTDEVTPGQWIKGKVYTRRCDVSPNGKYLVAAITDYSSRRKPAIEQYGLKFDFMADGWTAISKPPYFTALGLWFTGGAWNGGGAWQSDARLLVNNDPHTWHEAISPKGAPFRISKMNLGGSEDEPIYSLRLKRDGWITESEYQVRITNKKAYDKFGRRMMANFFKMIKGDYEGTIELMRDFVRPEWEMTKPGRKIKPFDKGTLVYEQWLDQGKAIYEGGERWSLLDLDGNARKRFLPKRWHPQFLDVDQFGRVIFGERGCLWTWEEFPDGKPKLIVDLNANEFEAVAPPAWATVWE